MSSDQNYEVYNIHAMFCSTIILILNVSTVTHMWVEAPFKLGMFQYPHISSKPKIREGQRVYEGLCQDDNDAHFLCQVFILGMLKVATPQEHLEGSLALWLNGLRETP